MAAGFLAGYSGRTREAYTLDLPLFVQWCEQHRLRLFDVTRTHIELYARELEDFGRAPATIGRRLSTLAGFYRYATEEGVIDHSPAVHVRRPKLDYESQPWGWTATSSAPSSCRRGCAWLRTTPCVRCWP